MKVYDKTGKEHNITEYDGSFSYFGIKKLTTMDDVNATSINETANSYGLGMGLIGEEAYASLYLGWINIQFKVSSGGQGLFVRYKYGNSAWSDWTRP